MLLSASGGRTSTKGIGVALEGDGGRWFEELAVDGAEDPDAVVGAGGGSDGGVVLVLLLVLRVLLLQQQLVVLVARERRGGEDVAGGAVGEGFTSTATVAMAKLRGGALTMKGFPR
ncbi:hypothetical protein B296_00004233 [Ensete ventricosum]|uniref:Uncharacterized protein n=1 Tax=Ensete ventricosum TaxID=4639 RepID=A0A427AV99_ENSVE|nr:hypothetical protein B296_00004233 [Ensete ventricosum]